MGLTPQQALLYLEKYTYFEVYYNDKRYGFCSEYDKTIQKKSMKN